MCVCTILTSIFFYNFRWNLQLPTRAPLCHRGHLRLMTRGGRGQKKNFSTGLIYSPAHWCMIAPSNYHPPSMTAQSSCRLPRQCLPRHRLSRLDNMSNKLWTNFSPRVKARHCRRHHRPTCHRPTSCLPKLRQSYSSTPA